MTVFAVIVCTDQNGWTERRRTYSVQPSASGVTALSNPTRVSVTLLKRTRAGAREVASIRIRVGSGRAHRCMFNTRTNDLARLDFQSALTPHADTGGLRGFLLPAFRLRFQFFPALEASGSLLSRLSIAIQLRQKSFRGCSKAFHSVSSLLSPADINGRRMRQSAVKG